MSFGDVAEGELGGFIERENNLDQSGDAWVYGDAQVCGDARVCGDAQVYGDAPVSYTHLKWNAMLVIVILCDFDIRLIIFCT